jgi:D-sedoheptulose 7-phosphate isomerase
MTATSQIAHLAAQALLQRNGAYQKFFDAEAHRLALACSAMAGRFARGGRLLAFGQGPYATDAQHVSVEFIHPVVVGKRALPAIDVSAFFDSCLETLALPGDILMGFGPPGGSQAVSNALAAAGRSGAMTFSLPGAAGDYAVPQFSPHPFEHQEMIEILYHTLWETVHVFLEHGELGSGAGEAAFLYPFLDSGSSTAEPADLTAQVAASIRAKVADDTELRRRVAEQEAGHIAAATAAIGAAVRRCGKLLLLGNGGSATDANDWAWDCVAPPRGMHPIPALSLAAEPAILTALSNDIGPEVIFLRQLAAHAQPGDVVIGISTSGGSRNLLAAFEEARRRKLTTVALLGYDGGEVVRLGLADHPIVVRSDYIPRIQEVQASIYHLIRELLEVTAYA